MQNYTRLCLKKLEFYLSSEEEKKWEQLAGEEARSGFPFPQGSYFSRFVEIGFQFIEEYFKKFLEAEKLSLEKQPALAENYFIDLSDEATKILREKCNILRSKALKRVRGANFPSNGAVKKVSNQIPGPDRGQTTRENTVLTRQNGFSYNRVNNPIPNGIIAHISHEESSLRDWLITNIDLLKEELRLGISHSLAGTTIHVGGDVGVINTGRVYGSIHAKLQRISKPETKELIDAFSHLAEAIQRSDIPDDPKREQLENAEFLVTQYEIPEERRNKGVMKAVMDSLSLASNITTIWTTVGPIITKALGIN